MASICAISSSFVRMSISTSQSLTEAAKAGNIDGLYQLLKEDSRLLERIDEDPFINTPLHVAAENGKTHFAMEVMGLKPSMARKLNPDGLSPLHLAVKNNYPETAKRLVKIDSELVRVQGKERKTPLHYVAERGIHPGDTDLLVQFLRVCPKSIKDRTVRAETAVHIAVKNGRVEIFEVLLGWLQRVKKGKLLNRKDEDGNTALHIAASTNQLQVVRLLINEKIVRKNVKNLARQTALDMDILPRPQQRDATREIRNVLHRGGALPGESVPDITNTSVAASLRSKESFLDCLCRMHDYAQRCFSNETRTAVLVVAVLIASATYQGVTFPPSPPQQGITMQQGLLLQAATVTNTVAFVASIAVILLTMKFQAPILHAALIFQLARYGFVMLGSFWLDLEQGDAPITSFAVMYFLLCIFFYGALIELLRRREKSKGVHFHLKYIKK